MELGKNTREYPTFSGNFYLFKELIEKNNKSLVEVELYRLVITDTEIKLGRLLGGEEGKPIEDIFIQELNRIKLFKEIDELLFITNEKSPYFEEIKFLKKYKDKIVNNIFNYFIKKINKNLIDEFDTKEDLEKFYILLDKYKYGDDFSKNKSDIKINYPSQQYLDSKELIKKEPEPEVSDEIKDFSKRLLGIN